MVNNLIIGLIIIIGIVICVNYFFYQKKDSKEKLPVDIKEQLSPEMLKEVVSQEFELIEVNIWHSKEPDISTKQFNDLWEVLKGIEKDLPEDIDNFVRYMVTHRGKFDDDRIVVRIKLQEPQYIDKVREMYLKLIFQKIASVDLSQFKTFKVEFFVDIEQNNLPRLLESYTYRLRDKIQLEKE